MEQKIYTCECGKTFSTPNSFNGHKTNCKTHHIIKYGSLDKLNIRLEKTRATVSKTVKKQSIKLRKEKQEKWLFEKHTCEKCGKLMTEKYGSGRFCSRYCANSKPSKKVSHTCTFCNKEFVADIRHADVCEDCHRVHNKSKIRCNICGQLNCANDFCKSGNKLTQIKTLIKYFTFNRELLGTKFVFEEWNRVKNMLSSLYWDEGKTSSELASMFGYPDGANLVSHIFDNLKIPKKTVSVGVQQAIKNGVSNIPLNTYSKYKCGWHTTWKNTQVYLRSSYELAVATKLDELKLDYVVEKLRIEYYDKNQNKTRVAVPDFYLPEHNMIIEVKSDYTLDKDEMLCKKEAYELLGYNFVLVCDHKILEL